MLCPNKNCQRIVSSYDDQCPHCGTPLKDNPVKKYSRDADRIIENWNHRSSPHESKIHAETRKESTRGLLVRSTEDLHALEGGMNHIINNQWRELLDAWKQIFSNHLVQSNKEWTDKAQRTYLWFDHRNEEVNGFATTVSKMEQDDDGRATLDQIEARGEIIRGKYDYFIAINGGYINFAYAVASTSWQNITALGFYNMEKLAECIRMLKEGNKFSVLHILRLAPDTTLSTKYGNAAFKAVYECVAHELGHICYGHVSGPGYGGRVTEANIGQEFDADSFAYSVIASSNFKEELWRGLIQFLIVESVLEILRGRTSATTHPLMIDRLKTAIRRFPDLAAERNVNEQWAEEIAAQLRNWLS